MQDQVLQIRLDKHTKTLFKIACVMSGVSQSDVIKEAINKFIDENMTEETTNEN